MEPCIDQWPGPAFVGVRTDDRLVIYPKADIWGLYPKHHQNDAGTQLWARRECRTLIRIIGHSYAARSALVAAAIHPQLCLFVVSADATITSVRVPALVSIRVCLVRQPVY